jgi:tripeptidyl-peptidase-1
MRYYHLLSALSFLTAVLLPDLAMSLEPWDDMQVKHAWNAVPVDWESLGHPPAGTTITLYVALKPERESALIDALSEVSNPRHPRHILLTTPPLAPLFTWLLLHFRYGAYLSKDQVSELVRPYPDTLDLVSAWLVHHGIQSSSISMTHGGAWLTVTDVLVSKADQLLGASYQLYRNARTNNTIIRTVGYALPAVLHTHIKTVAPTTYFTSTRVMRHRRSFGAAPAQAATGELVTALSSRAGTIEPANMHWLYKTYAYQPSATDQNRLAVVGFQGQLPCQEDLTRFMSLFVMRAQAATFTVVQVNGGGNNPNNPGIQANTDLQYAGAMAYPTPLIFYSIGGNMQFGPNDVPVAGDRYLEWYNHVLVQQNIAPTISLSFGDFEQNLPAGYAWALCDLFGRLGLGLGAMSVSILVVSGSVGVGDGDCVDTQNNVRFIAEFPSSCTCGVLSPLPSTRQVQVHVVHHHGFAGPWVTTVGGTVDYPEVAAGISGGGFSVHFPRPSYQRDAVSDYLRILGSEHAGYARFRDQPDLCLLCNSCSFSGRAYPDIASQAVNYQVVRNNIVEIFQGTDCAVSVCLSLLPTASALWSFSDTQLTANVQTACQTVAGIILLINDFRISHNQPKLGFLNPWLYGLYNDAVQPEGLYDIIAGSNPGCNTNGFPAIPGWDPVCPARLSSLTLANFVLHRSRV